MSWVAHDIRDELVDFVRHWSERTEICYEQLLGWIELSARKFRDWRVRYGKVNEHNYLVPRDHWLEEWEKKAIIDFYYQYPLEGYRRLCFMMLDRDLVAVNAASAYRALKGEGVLGKWVEKRSPQGRGIVRAVAAAAHP